MGLDMSAYSVPNEAIGDQQVDMIFPKGTTANEIAYWRKFHQLHGWMERLYRAKNGPGETFNCNDVRLMPEDVNQLETDAKNGLPATQGFFFGNGEWNEECEKEVLDFVALCRAKFAEGQAVFYSSWW